MDALKTYTVSIPSVALGVMAALLATKRVDDRYSICAAGWTWLGVERIDTVECPSDYPASAEYYRIIDRISRGEAP